MKAKSLFRFQLPKLSAISIIVFWMRTEAFFKKFWKEFSKVYTFSVLVMIGWYICTLFYVDYLSDPWLTYITLIVLNGMFSFVHWYMLKSRDFDNPVLMFYPTIFSAVIMFAITWFSLFSIAWTIVIAAVVYSDICDEKKALKDEQALEATLKELDNLVLENDFEAKGYETKA